MANINGKTSSEESEDSLIEMTFNLLKSGEKEIQLQNHYKNAVLVVGDTGNGKSKFTTWITGDDAKLIAKETVEYTGEYIIEDIYGESSSTITSDTVYPTLVIDTETNVPYYDCPGFNDSRSTSNDIATTYFIKKIVDYYDLVKIIFVISYPSVRKGVDRHNFMRLVKHATEFIKNVEKFQNSIALVVTKVDNIYIEGGKVLVDDSKVVETVTNFLEEVKQDVSVKVVNSNSVERSFYETAIKFISYLLKTDGEQHVNIGIFRRPDRSGPLSELQLLQKGKENIKKIINRNLTFTDKVDDDFGYTISVKSKHIIGRLVEEINNRVWHNLLHITEEITQHYRDLVNEIQGTIKTFGNANSPLVPDQIRAEKVSTNLREGYKGILNLIKDVGSGTNPCELATKVNTFLTDFEITVSEHDVLNIEVQGKYFSFLQVVSEEKLNSRNWSELFKRVENLMSDFWKKLQEDIDYIGLEIQKKLSSCFDWISRDIQNQLDEKIKQLEIQEVSEKLNDYSSSMLCLVDTCKNAASINEYLKFVRDAMRHIDISLPNDIALKVIKLSNSLKFIQKFCKKDYCLLLSDYFQPLHNVVNHMNESTMWYKFFDSIYNKFSEYEIQKDKEKYNVADLENWGKSKGTQGIFITQKNFQNFLQNLIDYNIADLEAIKNITLTEIRIEELNQVLNLTLRKEIKVEKMEYTVFVTGDYIRISDILNDPKKSSLLKSGSVKFIYMFASKTIFIDGDLIFPGFGLSIIAPKWEIIGKRKINLDGADGKQHSKAKASDGCGEGRNGQDGEPGFPGKPGGTFFGIGETFVNGTLLTITTNGGDGSPGQHGGNGKDGQCGQAAQLPTSGDTPSQRQIEDGLTSIKGFTCEKIGGTDSVISGTNVHGGMNANIVHKQKFHADYKIFGHAGKRGGDGGNGGKGGEGGNPGVVTLYELNTKSGILTHFERGRGGKDGKGGERGLGGYGGNHIIARCRMYRPDPFLRIFGAKSTTDWNLTEQIDNYNRGCSGRNGGDGTNTRGSQPLEPPNIIFEPFEIVTMYKRFLIENFNCRFKRSLLMSLFNTMNGNEEIKSIYNTIGLIEEFQGVEHELVRSTVEQSLFIHIYQSLLSRICDHAKRLKGLKDESDVKVLKYLYTTILSQIFVLTVKSQTDLIIDLRKYLDMIKVDIETLKELQVAGRKISMIKELKEDYNFNVNKRIEEAQTFIIEQILPEFDKIKQQIDNDIHLLIEESMKLQLAAKEEKDYLIMKRGEIEDSLVQKNILNSFKLIANVVSFLGPVGEAASCVIETTTSVLGSLVSDESETPPKTNPNITSFVQLVENGINAITNGSLNSLTNLLGIVSNEISNCPEFLQDLLPVIEGVTNQKNDMSVKSLGMMGIKTLENDLKLALKRKEEETLKIQQGDPKSNDALKMISRLNKIVEFGSIIQDFQIDNKLGTEKIDEITYAIDQANKKFHSLKQYEEKIYDSIAPMLKNIEENIFETASNMESKSRIALDITKWQVQSSLKNVQLQMQGITEGFKAQHNIVRCFDMLQEAMTIIIKVYDRIEYYREQKTLANYIADISSITVSNVNISDQRLVKALNRLDIALKSNLILNQYKAALDAFNQWVFPFSQNYIEDSMLPSHFKFETTIENLVTNCISHIDYMKKKVDAYKISVMKNDKFIHHEEFNSRNRSTKPFFVWKNEQYKHLISRFLSGQEIILKADVKKSPTRKDAIKFNFIEFFFRCKNESFQPQLDQILKGFDIQATHTGNSYYRYLNKIYLITSDQQTIFYSLEKNADGENVRTNAVYDKIRKGDLMMSPYTLWQLKLVGSTSRSSFEELKMFEYGIDLELIGHGSYVMNLKQFNLTNEDYRLVEIYNEFDQYLD